jgi:hypothetical protein
MTYGPKTVYECTDCECAKKHAGSSSDYGGAEYRCHASPDKIGSGTNSFESFREIRDYPKTPEFCPLLPQKLVSGKG